MAEGYLADPRFYWNSGMVLFSAGAFWQQLEEHAPQIYALMHGSYEEAVSRFSAMPDLSIDYALMEKSQAVLVCPLSVQWSDVGSWDSVYETMEKDQNHNVKIGQVVDIDTKNSLIVSGKRLISTIGVEDLLIVETEDALFVSKKGESQRVKGLVKELAQRGRKEGAMRALQTHPWGTVHLLSEGDEYSIKKVQLNEGQRVKGRHAIPLKGTFVVQGEFLVNDTDQRVEFLLIEFFKALA